MALAAVIPAHNESGTIHAAVESLQSQSSPPDLIWVIADNCTDDTAAVATAAGARVYDTSVAGNRDKKAGALNLFLPMLLEELDDEDTILVMDADSRLAPAFIEIGLDTMSTPGTVVGGVFYGDPGGGIVGLLQRNEYARYARDIYAKADQAMVLTGTATIHRAGILREIAAGRGTVLPGSPGQIYDTAVLTEDNEMTLAIKTLGYACVSPAGCQVFTEVMPTLRDLWRQRLRWQRGALENLRQYGMSGVTRPYMIQQAVMAFGLLAMLLYVTASAWQLATGQLTLSYLSLFGLIFCAERAVTVASRGWRQQLLASTLVLEFLYDLFLQAVLVKSILDTTTGRQANWHHVTKG